MELFSVDSYIERIFCVVYFTTHTLSGYITTNGRMMLSNDE
jgi:hypothetical protein